MTIPEVKMYTLGDEIANGITHGIGAGLSIAAMSVLVTLAALHGDGWRLISFSIYGTTLVLLYLASTCYHSFQSPGVKRVFRLFDHLSIYLLIAGTYTPFTLVSLKGPWGWTLFGLVWGLALFGVFLTLFMNRYRGVALAIYLGMGWLGIVAIKPLFQALPAGGLALMGIGGLAYTVGVVFYKWEKLPFNHAIWHVFVLGGSACHFFSILYYVLPMDRA